ncbi:unnamed protein product [Anisakis simplex]|uniref:G_PROTEIN_RECEP_F1_2 domain-containing protein n=1 Tax=Anisakis simplex TaxID=6269 RepID=A0A0M3JT25_ANISI|nr:unnamed protein product [Anisakis simplex]
MSSFKALMLYVDRDAYVDEKDLLANDPIVRSVGGATLLIYFVAVIVGIPANVYVLFRMQRLARNDGERYRSGTGVALCSMAAADLCSLLLILAQNLMQMSPQIDDDTIFMGVVCKLMLFCTHTVTGISIWSWLLLSTLRYLAVRHPLFHMRIWRMPYRALAFIVLMSLALNAWLLIAVHSTPFGCTQLPVFDSLKFNRMFHIVESIWSFCVPFIMIIFMDASVLLKSKLVTLKYYQNFIDTPFSFRLLCLSFPSLLRSKPKRKAIAKAVIINVRSSSLHAKQRHSRFLWKWLAIALICIILNTPENLYRLVMLFGMPEVHEEALHFAARMLAQALYFSQFAFNAVYLAVFVFDKSTRPKGSFEVSTNCNCSLLQSCKICKY